MKTVIAAAIMTLAAVPAGAQNCLNPLEAQALLISALPDAVEAARERCAATLPATAPLVQAGALIAARWRAEAIAVENEAALALDKFTGIPVAKTLGQSAARSAAKSLVARQVAERLAAEDCPVANEIVDGLSPLPARNVARVMIALASTDAAARRSPLPLCKAG